MTDEPPSGVQPPEGVPEPTQPGWAAPSATPPAPAPPVATDWSQSWSSTPPTPPVAPPAASEGWNTAPPKKRTLTWLWILLGVLGLVAALVVVAVVLFVRSITGPIDATNDVLARIKAQDYPAAYRISCSQDRTAYTERQYAQAFTDTVSELGAVKSYDVNYSSVHGSRAEVRYDIAFAGGKTNRLQALALKEGGKWHTCLLSKP